MTENPPINTKSNLSLISWVGLAISLLIIIYFFGFYDTFVQGRQSAFTWLESAWNPETDYEHGWMVPILAAFMLWQSWQNNIRCAKAPSLYGLSFVALGALLCVLAVRTQQGRVAIGALPFLLSGLIWCYWGWRSFLSSLFPCFFLWLSIPLPGFQQATVGLQLIATDMAHLGAGLCGVETIVDGTNITSASGNWDTYNIAGGCSGIRSLMALIMISVAWGYLAFSLAPWKRITLALSAIPLSIIANSFRVASIFVCAEYVNPAFAGKTWHDWSGLIFFFPCSMICLMILHGLLAGEIPFLHKRKVVIRRNSDVSTSSENNTPSTPQA